MKAYLKALRELLLPFALLMFFSYFFIQPVWDDNQDAGGTRYFAMMSIQVAFGLAWYQFYFSVRSLLRAWLKRKRRR